MTNEQVDEIVALIRAGNRAEVGGGRTSYAYFVRDSVFIAEYFDEGTTEEHAITEESLREVIVREEGSFAELLKAPLRASLAESLRDTSPAGRATSRQHLAALRAWGDGAIHFDLLDAALAWPESTEPFAPADGNNAYHAIMTALRYPTSPSKTSPKVGEVALRFFAALEALQPDFPDLCRHRADFREMAGDIEGALDDLESARKQLAVPDEYLDRHLERLRNIRFLQEIAASPDDDGPRLVWADALLERGNPRGSFIIDQCALAKLDEDDPARIPIEFRSKRLLKEHGSDWVNVRDARWTRGIVDSVGVRWTLFDREADAIFGIVPPVREIRFVVLKNESMAAPVDVLNDARLEDVPALDFGNPTFETSDGRLDFHADLAAAIATRFPKLRKLTIEDGAFTESELASIGSRAALTELSLEGTDASDLFAGTGLRGLRTLKLRECGLDDASAARLADLTGLEELDLSRNFFLTSATLVALARLPLRRLDLHHCHRLDDLRPLTKLTSLRSLDLSHCEVGNEAVLALADMSLSRLDLEDNAFDGAGLEALFRGRLAGSVRRLSVGTWSDHITKGGDLVRREKKALKDVVHLFSRLPRLWELEIRGSDLDAGAIRALLDSTPELRSLTLSNSYFDDRGLRALFTHPRFPQIEILEIDMCGVTSDAGRFFRDEAKHFPSRLGLHYNSLTDLGFRNFLRNPAIARIAELDLRGCDITEEGRALIGESPLRPVTLWIDDP